MIKVFYTDLTIHLGSIVPFQEIYKEYVYFREFLWLVLPYVESCHSVFWHPKTFMMSEIKVDCAPFDLRHLPCEVHEYFI